MQRPRTVFQVQFMQFKQSQNLEGCETDRHEQHLQAVRTKVALVIKLTIANTTAQPLIELADQKPTLTFV